MKKFLFGVDFDNFTVDDVANFLAAYDSGVLQPFYKSEPEQPTHDGPIRILVGTNHDDFVTDAEIFVMYYIQWDT